MLQLASFSIFLALFLQAHGQVPSTGIPASVVSPTAGGQQHGIPASVVSPKPPIQGAHRPDHVGAGFRRPLRPFGDHRRRQVLVPVPLFYPAYGQTYYGDSTADVADPAVADSGDTAAPSDDDGSVAQNEDALRRAYLQGARDALSRQEDRFGKHSPDSSKSAPSKALAQNKPDPSPAVQPEVDDSPTTVFIFKDGRQIETRNFAIMGQTLYDFTSTGLQKVQLSDLDTTATQKANDDRGITVKLP